LKTANVAIIGTKFMGKAHSNAWSSAPKFFDLPIQPVLKVACGRDEQATREFTQTWGWEEVETD
jgi:myo-inositol 2-dehydrogenase/D-chiro-inositol 1-dehydrogenase